MRVMAIDYGDARTGVAVSDATATLAGDAWVIHSKNMRETAGKVLSEAAARDVSRIVVGHPKNMDGSIGKRAQKCEEFASILRSQGFADVALWDERLTTKGAHVLLDAAGKRGRSRKKVLDAVAASLILESYLGNR